MMSVSEGLGSSSSVTCQACGGRRMTTSETIGAGALAEAWRREDEAVGALDIMNRRTDELLAALPEVIRFHRCEDCGLQTADPAIVWSASAYPRDQSYPERWEFGRCLDDLV